jgi:hypothetical protein
MKKYCSRGHLLNESNLRWEFSYLRKKEYPRCRACHAENERIKRRKRGLLRSGSKPLTDVEYAKIEERRFFGSFEKQSDGCWKWKHGLNYEGYGHFRVRRKTLSAHRYSYQKFVGPVPEGKELHHLCDHPWCVNPEHLKPVTSLEHARTRDQSGNGKYVAAYHSAKTHCPRGHPYSGDNLILEKRSDGGIARRCKICAIAKTKKYLAKKRGDK